MTTKVLSFVLPLVALALVVATPAAAQPEGPPPLPAAPAGDAAMRPAAPPLPPMAPGAGGASNDEEALKLVALEGLMAAPPQRAMPLLRKVLAGDSSDVVKSRALFVLSQIGLPEARALLLETARAQDISPRLRLEAIRMVGIGGDREALTELVALYRDGDSRTRQSVLEALLIAGDAETVYALARDAAGDEDFAAAVRTLSAMGAVEQLRRLRDRGGDPSSLIQAYAVAGDLESLRALAAQTEDPQRRVEAIRHIGIVGGEQAGDVLLELYRGAGDEPARRAALEGLLISGNDEGVLALYRESEDAVERRELLRVLLHMDSDLALEVIDLALQGGQP